MPNAKRLASRGRGPDLKEEADAGTSQLGQEQRWHSHRQSHGVNLDGPARPECTPSHGAYFNSDIQYGCAADIPRLALVIAEDQTVDVIPELRLRIKRSTIFTTIAALEAATADNFDAAIRWLDQHRFYLSLGRCDRINTTLERIQNEPIEVGKFRIQWPEFSLHPDLADSYFMSEDAASASG